MHQQITKSPPTRHRTLEAQRKCHASSTFGERDPQVGYRDARRRGGGHVGARTWSSWVRLQAVDRIAAVADASAYMFTALHNLRIDRATGTRELNAEKPAKEINPLFVEARAAEMPALKSALSTLERRADRALDPGPAGSAGRARHGQRPDHLFPVAPASCGGRHRLDLRSRQQGPDRFSQARSDRDQRSLADHSRSRGIPTRRYHALALRLAGRDRSRRVRARRSNASTTANQRC